MIIRDRHPIVVVGAGPAGVAAALQCSRLGSPPLLLDRSGLAGGLLENASLIENYPGLGSAMGGQEAVTSLRRDLGRAGLVVERANLQRVSVDNAGVVHGAGGLLPFVLQLGDPNGEHGSVRRVAAGAVILATGTRPKGLGVPGEQEWSGERVFTESSDLLKRSASRRFRRVVVVGAGEAAADYALSLAAANLEVMVVLRGERLKVRGWLERRFLADGRITVARNWRCRALGLPGHGVLHRDEVLEPDGVQTGDRLRIQWEHVPCEPERRKGSAPVPWSQVDALLVAVGRETFWRELVSCSDGEGDRAVPGLYVVGDACRGTLGQMGVAVGDGLLAGAAAVEHLEGRTC